MRRSVGLRSPGAVADQVVSGLGLDDKAGEQRYAEEVARGDEPPGDVTVGCARSGVRKMVVTERHTRATSTPNRRRSAGHVPRWHTERVARRRRPSRDAPQDLDRGDGTNCVGELAVAGEQRHPALQRTIHQHRVEESQRVPRCEFAGAF